VEELLTKVLVEVAVALAGVALARLARWLVGWLPPEGAAPPPSSSPALG